jgi:ATP-dependent exoDNAse (exonuclease V) beta subunit
MSDAGARERAIFHDGSVLVQAPAGSGKTTLLVQRYLHLLAAVSAPEQILALTFTRRAAEEMRERVAQALQAAREPGCPKDMNPQTWALGVAAARQMDQHGIDLAQHPARLRIETIDAFNAWLAGQLPVAAATGARLRTEDKPAVLYREAARRALAYEESDAFGMAVERVLALADYRWQTIVNRVVDMLAGRDRWLPLLAGGLEAASEPEPERLLRIRREFDADLAFLVTRSLQRAAQALGQERLATLSQLQVAAARRLQPERADLDPWRKDDSCLRADPADLPRWRALLPMILTQARELRTRVTKTEGFPPNCADKAAVMDLLQELDRVPDAVAALADLAALPNPAYDDADWERVRDVAQVLLLSAIELEQLFRERGTADFPAVAMAAQRALGAPEQPSDLALRLDYRLQHVLVDEFQDTSATQLSLLRLLTAGWQPGDGRSVFCVGDPMQSIYRFRQAEVRAFLELAEDGVGDIRFDLQRLQRNFRTAAPLVEWVNARFAAIMPDHDDRDLGAIAYRPSESARLAPDSLSVGVTQRGFAERGDEAGFIADLVATRLAEHPDWHIAILVRARSHATDIARALRTRGIAFGAIDIEPIQEHGAVRDLIMLARALLHWGDRTAWFAVLRAPWVGLELQDLLVISRGAAIPWEALADETVLAGMTPAGAERCRRVVAVLEQGMTLRTHSDFSRWLERIWLGLGGPCCVPAERDLEPLRAAFTRLREMEGRGLPDPSEFSEAFADLYAREEGAHPVEIMTIHKAKGLEFDLVILPALERSITHRSDELLLAMPFARPERDGMVMAARPAIGADENLLFRFLATQARQAVMLESERLLYVACTRAKWQLVLTATLELDDDRQAKAPRNGSLLQLLWPSSADAFTVAPAPAGAGAAQSAELRGGPLLRVPLEWRPDPVQAPLLLEDPPIDLAFNTQVPVFDWAGETARQIGSLVHAELQSLQIETQDAAGIATRKPRFRTWLALRGVPVERLDDAAARVVEALRAVLGDARGRWILMDGHREAVREQALSGIWKGEIVRVVLDRSFIDADGVRWVIDYKTSRHAGGGLEEFLDREVERYRPQLERYAALVRHLGPEPVRVGLYFPLMQSWREWAP